MATQLKCSEGLSLHLTLLILLAYKPVHTFMAIHYYRDENKALVPFPHHFKQLVVIVGSDQFSTRLQNSNY